MFVCLLSSYATTQPTTHIQNGGGGGDKQRVLWYFLKWPIRTREASRWSRHIRVEFVGCPLCSERFVFILFTPEIPSRRVASYTHIRTCVLEVTKKF